MLALWRGIMQCLQRFYFQIYSTHSRSVYDPTGMILAISNREVPHMLQRFSRRSHLNGFYHIWAWRPSWISDQNHFSCFLFPRPLEATNEFGYTWPSGFRGEVVWTEDGGCPFYKPRSLWLRGAKKRLLQNRWRWNLVCSIEYSCSIKSVEMMTLGLPWPFYVRSNMGKMLITRIHGEFWRFWPKIGYCNILNEFMRIYEKKSQCHSLTLDSGL